MKNKNIWQEAEKFLVNDKFIGLLVKKWGHCTIKPRVYSDYFQALVGEIIGQQLSGKVADVIENRLKIKIKGKLTPNKILKLSGEDLRSCGMAWSKVRAIDDLCANIKNNKLKIKNLSQLSDDEVRKQLIQVKGIGPWTADMFLMFTLGRTDIFPNEDLGINKALKNLKIKAKDIEKWKPYRSIACWYLWRSLENK